MAEQWCYTISRNGEIPLNDFLRDLDDIEVVVGLRALNLRIKRTRVRDVKRALSYRHVTRRLLTDRRGVNKYLNDDCLAFLREYLANGGDVEGLWIDCLCIAPGGHVLRDAFTYMGNLYLAAEVIPFWLFQDDSMWEAYLRAWIFQESRFTRFDVTTTQAFFARRPHVVQREEVMRKLIGARNARIVFHGEQSLADHLAHFAKNPVIPDFKITDIVSAYLTANIEYENEICEAIFSVVQAAGIGNIAQFSPGNATYIDGIPQYFPLAVPLGSVKYARLLALFPQCGQDCLIFIGDHTTANTFGCLQVSGSIRVNIAAITGNKTIIVDYRDNQVRFGWSNFNDVFSGPQCEATSRINGGMQATYRFAPRRAYWQAMFEHVRSNANMNPIGMYFPLGTADVGIFQASPGLARLM